MAESRFRNDLRFRRRVRPDLNSLYQVDAMESSLVRLGVRCERVRSTPFRVFIDRVAKHTRVVRRLRGRAKSRYIVPILRRSEGEAFPFCYFNEIIPWSFDCWPPEYDQWEAFYRRIRVRWAFISARDSAAEMQRRIPGARFVWSPEAVDPGKYRPHKPLVERTIALLELGRRHEEFQAVAVPTMATMGSRHLFEPTATQKGTPRHTIFGPREEDLAAGLGDSMISVCYPASITHPEWSQGLETVTHRYFASIASRCVLLGQAPQELIDLFGYSPVISADIDFLRDQLFELVENIGTYQQFVDRNYVRLLEVGTWDVRAREILHEIDGR